MSDHDERRLYDPATRGQIGHRAMRRITLIIGVTSTVCGAFVGRLHVEELPFLATWLGYCDGVRYSAARSTGRPPSSTLGVLPAV